LSLSTLPAPSPLKPPTLERTFSDLVNQAYALAPAEIALMWQTAPPRMPITPHPPRGAYFTGWKPLWPVCQRRNANWPAKFLKVTIFSSVKWPLS